MMRILRRRIHSSWIIAVICSGILAGVIVSDWLAPEYFYSWVWLVVGLLLTGLALWRQRRYILPVAIIAGGLIGLWRGSVTQYDLQVYTQLIGSSVQVTGKVLEDADMTKRQEMIVRLGDVVVGGRPIGGKIWVTLSSDLPVQRSDYVTVTGDMQSGFASFSAAMYRADVVSHAPHTEMARDVRNNFSEKVQASISEPAVSLGLGFLTGQRRGLPPELLEILKIAGLTHVIVASGYNLTILVRIARRLFANISKYLATVVPAGLVIGFIAVTGMSPSMSRAGLVTGLSLLAWYYGRRFHPVVLLLFVAALSVLIDPTYAWGDIGWLLSFAAFSGVMIVAPYIQAYFYGDEKPPLIPQIFTETLSAYLTTLPILAVSFGVFSNVALMANVMILPLIPLVMLGVFVVGVAGFLSEMVSQVLAVPVQWVLEYMVIVATFWADQSWAQTEMSTPLWFVVGWYAVMAFGCVYLRYVTKYRLRMSNIVE